jgi:WD40 repeat protein
VPAQRLDYASTPSTRHPWSPILVNPSLRSCLLILLTVATAAWLAARHHPWTLTAKVALSGPDISQLLSFTSANHLITRGRGLLLWEPDTGQCIHEIGKTDFTSGGWHLTLNNATEILRLSQTVSGLHARLYDVESGALVKDVKLLDEPRAWCAPVAAAPTGRRVLFRTNPSRSSPDIPIARDTLSLWDLDAPATTQPTPPRPSFPLAGAATFSPDGRRVAIVQNAETYEAFDGRYRPDFDAVGVFDADTAKPLFLHRYANTPAHTAYFSPDGRRLLTLHFGGIITLLDATTGDTLNTFPSPSYNPSINWSASTQSVSFLDALAGPTCQLALRNTATGAFSTRTVVKDAHLQPQFFPDGRLLTFGPETRTLAVYANPSLRPLAIFRRDVRNVFHCAISPDNAHLAFYGGDSLRFYRRTGPDCPESGFGALAFPHLWLFLALATASLFSLRHDASRASADLLLPGRTFALLLFLFALPRTLHFLAATCIGESFLTPAPIILFASLGLATGARFWRLLTLIALSIALLFELYTLHLLNHAGLTARTPTLLFDRTYGIPNLATFVLLAVVTALVPVALYLLTRRER